MNLQPSDDEEQIIESARRFLSAEWPVRRLHEPDCALFGLIARRSFAAQGWFGIALPESAGGSGFSVIEEMLFYREMGRMLGPIDVLSTALAARISAKHDTALTSQLLAGDHGVAFCVSGRRVSASAGVSGHFRMIGEESATLGILLDNGSAILFDASSGARDLRPCLDKSVSMAEVTVRSAEIYATEDSDISSIGRLYVAAMMAGIAEAVTEMTVEYAKLRQTFGRPIGAYQAVRHPCADMAVRAEVARSQLFYSAVALRDEHADSRLLVNAAKLLANEAALSNVDANIQLHGGIATTDEHDAHLYMKRAQLLSRWFGGEHMLVPEILEDRVCAY